MRTQKGKETSEAFIACLKLWGYVYWTTQYLWNL